MFRKFGNLNNYDKRDAQKQDNEGKEAEGILSTGSTLVSSSMGDESRLQQECQRIAEDLLSLPVRLQREIQMRPAAKQTKRPPIDGSRPLRDSQSNLREAYNIIESLKTQVKRLELELAAAATAECEYQEKIQALRSAVLEETNISKIRDADVAKLFVELRQQIQQAVWDKSIDVSQIKSPLDMDQHLQFYSRLVLLSHKDRLAFTRAEIFSRVYESALNTHYFGTDGPDASTPLGDRPQNREIQFSEHQLREFERLLETKEVPKSIISRWRLATIHSLSAAGLLCDCGTTLAAQLCLYLEPLIAKEASKAERDRIFSRFLSICQAAYKLRLLMRSSTEEYRIVTIPPGRNLLEYQSVAECVEVMDDGGNVDVIAFTIYGALLKATESREDREVVIEKAHVVTED